MDKRPKGRVKKVVEGTAKIERQGEGLGGGPVGNRNGETGLNKEPQKKTLTKSQFSTDYSDRSGADANNNRGLLGQILTQQTQQQQPQQSQQSSAKKTPSLKRLLIMALIVIIVIVILAKCSKACSGKIVDDSDYDEEYFTVATTASGYNNQTSGVLESLLSVVPAGYNWEDLSSNYYSDTWNDNTQAINTTVAAGVPGKKTELLGGGRDTVTVMVYMCASDLESQCGAATDDIQEMLKASFGDNVNLILFTGGTNKWHNNIMSTRYNQVYRIAGGQISRLVENFGTGAVTSGRTLSEFIDLCATNFEANRNILVLWDHGGGSLSGYGYDEKNTGNGSMSLPELKEAIEATGVTFDIIGFDACLMGTVETGLALADSADYLIASEESEASGGWYYTNWLTSLGNNTSISSVELGKIIADDFVDYTNRYCPGMPSTLSVTDLVELSTTVPAKLEAFGANVSQLIDAGNSGSSQTYVDVAKARGKSREFASSSHVDQVDIVDFAQRIGTSAANDLAEAVLSAVKYNNVSRDMSGSYGLSIYFPYANYQYSKVASSIYDKLDICDEYQDCVEKYASTELTGQYVSGGGSPFESLFGISGNSSYSGYSSSSGSGYDFFGSSSSSAGYGDIFGSLFGSSYDSSDSYGSYGSTGSSSYGGYSFGGSDYGNYSSDISVTDILSLFSGRSLPASFDADKTAELIAGNIFDQTQLELKENSDGQKVISMDDEQWKIVDHLLFNVYYDDGEGLIDLGTDNVYDFDAEGNLICESDGTWLSIDGNTIAYYYESMYYVDDDNYLIKGYSPIIYNDQRAKLIIAFDNERPDGYIVGIQIDYRNSDNAIPKIFGPVSEDTSTEEAEMCNYIPVGAEITFVADYYDYSGNYVDNYKIGSWKATLNPEIANMQPGEGTVLSMYSFTDIYNQTYWSEIF